jgi:hypothetical protein
MADGVRRGTIGPPTRFLRSLELRARGSQSGALSRTGRTCQSPRRAALDRRGGAGQELREPSEYSDDGKDFVRAELRPGGRHCLIERIRGPSFLIGRIGDPMAERSVVGLHRVRACTGRGALARGALVREPRGSVRPGPDLPRPRQSDGLSRGRGGVRRGPPVVEAQSASKKTRTWMMSPLLRRGIR